MSIPDTSLTFRLLGHRSIFSWMFGDFFSRSTNTSGLLAFALVAAAIYLFVTSGSVPDRLADAVFLVVGFYFGGATVTRANSKPSDRALP